MNILITSIGKRNYLVNHFKDSLKDENCGIYGADCNEFVSALRIVDKAFKIPPAYSPNYSEKLIELCRENEVSGVLSINDLELPYLARIKKKLLKIGIVPIISDPEVIEIAFDKYLTYKFLINNNILAPKTYLCTEIDKITEDINKKIIEFPIISKPRKGSGSKGIYMIEKFDELLMDMKKFQLADMKEDEKNIYQEQIDSEQYSIHIFNNWNLKPVSIIGMVNILKHLDGETFHIKTFRDDKLIELGKKIAESLGHFGPLSLDVHKKGSEYVVLELNPRIAGCYSLSHYAGADYPKKIFQIINKEEIKFNRVDEYKDCLVMLKNYSTTFTDQKEVIESTQVYI